MKKTNEQALCVTVSFFLFCAVFSSCDMDSNNPDKSDVTESYSENGHRYEVINQSMSWANAMVDAERRGGHLATITDEGEQRFIEKILTKKGSKHVFWLGGYLSGDSWIWIDSTPFSRSDGTPILYTNWASVEPSGNGESRLVIIGSSPDISTWKKGEWGDMPNTDVGTGFWWDVGFIIEWDNIQ